MGQAKYTTAIVREILAEEGWVLLSEYQYHKQKLIISHKNFYDGASCYATISGWLAGRRPNSVSLVNPTEVVRSLLAKEGWVLESDYIRYGGKLYIRNKNVLSNHLCQFTFASWQIGCRPDIRSLVDPTSYIREIVEKEGWELLSDYKGKKVPQLIRNPEKFNGWVCLLYIDNWLLGSRPSFHSLVDPEEYVRSELEKEEWELLSPYKGCHENFIIRNKNFFNGSSCYFSWGNWTNGFRPAMVSLVNPTEYVKYILNENGFSLLDERWEYGRYTDTFKIFHNEYKTVYSTSWNAISQGLLPCSPKRLILSRIRTCLKTQKIRNSYLSDLFNEEYWEALNIKFPNIKPGLSLDHVIPMSFYGYTWEQMRLANDLRNLRLLTSSENSSRSNRLRASELDEYDLWDLYYQAENPIGYKIIEDRYDLAS
jgi:hypothetical protein